MSNLDLPFYSERHSLIISASRRSDIPAFYSEWLLNRVREGYCSVPNPFNRKQVATVSLSPDDVDVFVFWTRNPRPMMSRLEELDRLGFHYYFQFTLVGYPRLLDQNTPSLDTSAANFVTLSKRIGAARLIWRYDPIVLTPFTDIQYHLENFEKIASTIEGFTQRCVVSLVDGYRKTKNRLNRIARAGAPITSAASMSSDQLKLLFAGINELANSHGMKISSCAEHVDLSPFGIYPGQCIDDDYIHELFDTPVASKKDPGQRGNCRCVVSKDIGMYDSCLYGCQYCYATSSFKRARANFESHDPLSPSLLGRYEVDLTVL